MYDNTNWKYNNLTILQPFYCKTIIYIGELCKQDLKDVNLLDKSDVNLFINHLK